MSAPRLSPHARLHYDRRRESWVLLAPERVLVLDDVAYAILRRLDGQHDVARLAAALAEEYDAPASAIAEDVREVLEDLRRKGLVQP
ncbi:pyrroloquinoline quinone biosynthesis peptide chaperone PqqD [Roseomonas sp. KE0001]|uniref:pyrroloquinoline quinone biosynthesis peptide chaperone PqqD n=1 Tax=Roseomonas sp. KE0001 TaxID=2479201 RepID=UPI0018E04ACC|nr:pyrroloquinoline quinone biosynthesis peptide chaperone PqqD [Roseomonas sp. KE0001]